MVLSKFYQEGRKREAESEKMWKDGEREAGKKLIKMLEVQATAPKVDMKENPPRYVP